MFWTFFMFFPTFFKVRLSRNLCGIFYLGVSVEPPISLTYDCCRLTRLLEIYLFYFQFLRTLIRFLYLLGGFLGQFQLPFDYNSSFTIPHLDIVRFFPDFLLDIIKRSLFRNVFLDPVWSYYFFCCLQIVWVDRLSRDGFIARHRLLFHFNSNV